MPTDEQNAKDAIAFAIEHGDNCHIGDGYADGNGWPEIQGPMCDWLSDWGAFMADRVFDELKARGFVIVRPMQNYSAANPIMDMGVAAQGRIPGSDHQ